MDHDVDFLMMMMYPLLLVVVVHDLRMPNMHLWNVDDDNQHNNYGNHCVEKIHQHLILVAKMKMILYEFNLIFQFKK